MTSETTRGLEAVGVLDTSTELGERVYQLVKDGTLSWSIGFIVPEGGKRRKGKITEITEIDLAEISVVSTPANAATRTISVKSLGERVYELPDGTTTDYKGLLEYTTARSRAEKAARPIEIVTFEC